MQLRHNTADAAAGAEGKHMMQSAMRIDPVEDSNPQQLHT